MSDMVVPVDDIDQAALEHVAVRIEKQFPAEAADIRKVVADMRKAARPRPHPLYAPSV